MSSANLAVCSLALGAEPPFASATHIFQVVYFVKDGFADLNNTSSKKAWRIAARGQSKKHQADELIAEVDKASRQPISKYLTRRNSQRHRANRRRSERVGEDGVRAMKEFSTSRHHRKDPEWISNHALKSTLTVCATRWRLRLPK